MTIIIKNALPSEKEAVKKVLKNMEDHERKEIESIGLAIKATCDCESSKEIEEAKELLRKARAPHIEALRCIKGATLVIE